MTAFHWVWVTKHNQTRKKLLSNQMQSNVIECLVTFDHQTVWLATWRGYLGWKLMGFGLLRPPPNGDTPPKLFQFWHKYKNRLAVENLDVTVFSHFVVLDGIHTPSFDTGFFVWDLPTPLSWLILSFKDFGFCHPSTPWNF